jgi:hypothetical protein
MKKILILVVVIIIIGLAALKFTSAPISKDEAKDNDDAPPVPTSQTVTVSDKLSEYKNDELGFSVKYPTVWEKIESSNNVIFVNTPDPKGEKNTMGKLESKIEVISAKCSFPPVTTVKERDTLKVGDASFNMISIANTVQGRNYFNRMYSLEKGPICYYFTFSSITINPSLKGFSGADVAKVSARNTAIVDLADSQFKDMVKSFKFVVSAVGQDETKIAPTK